MANFPTPEELGYVNPVPPEKPDFLEWLRFQFDKLPAGKWPKILKHDPPYKKESLTKEAWQEVHDAGWRLGPHYRGSGTALVPYWWEGATSETPFDI